LVDLLDRVDGDPDLEMNGDEIDISDGFIGREPVQRDGCDLTRGHFGEDDEDDDPAEDDDPGDVAWIERRDQEAHPPGIAPTADWGDRWNISVVGEDAEAVGDENDQSYTEWTSRGRHKLALGGSEPFHDHEDAEEDDSDTGVEDGPDGFDPEEDRCLAGDDIMCSGSALGYADDDGPGDPEDAEHTQVAGDVPCVAVYAIEPNVFNGQRRLLGYTLPRIVGDRLEPEL
jgi:hypothetical protein